MREKKNLSQEALASDADLSSSQISRIERGIISTSLSQIVSIAKALDIKPRSCLSLISSDFLFPSGASLSKARLVSRLFVSL